MKPPPGASTVRHRSRIVPMIGGVVVIGLLLGSRVLDVSIDWLWFGSVGFQSVFGTVLVTRIGQFLMVAAVFGLSVAAVLVMAFRARPVFVPTGGAADPMAPYRSAILRRPSGVAVGVSAVIGAIAGFVGQGNWQTTQLFLHSTPFGTTDPVFHLDVGFYAFQLPFYRWVLDLMFVAVVVCIVASLITHYLFGGLSAAGRAWRVSVAARAQLALLVGVFVLLKAVAYWLDRYSMLLSAADDNGGVFSGASYTDLNAVIPAKTIMAFIALICAATFFVGMFRHNLQLPSIAAVLLVLSSLLIGAAWPAVLQQFVVRPNANVRESTPIQRNIEATRAAFGLTGDNVTYVPYSGRSDATPAQVGADTATISNLRLLDPNRLSRTFTQLEQRKNFYGFPRQLNVDRYTVKGQVRDYVVAARELDSGALTANQTNWINQHMVYTHGNGFVAAPANQLNAALDAAGGQGGYPNFTVSDTSAQGDIPVSQPRIYYGRLINDYSIVGAAPGTAPREYDTDTEQTSYTGAGGVKLDGPLKRLAFGLAYGDQNILFNTSINSDSKILFVRDPAARVAKVAPWLTLDNDPYPAVVDGRIQWIIDGYTTLANYPSAEHVELGQATADTRAGVAPLPDKSVSYLRNSVKATVDAYDGSVSLYAFDGQDPVLKTWMKAFPHAVKPASAISPELRAHLRYPKDEFKVQREPLTRYHVDNPAEFFSTVSFWNVPADPTVNDGGTSETAQPPYYVLAGLPGRQGASFQLTSPLVSLQRPFLAAYVSASSDPNTYGHLTVLQLPTDTQTPGPQQAQNQFVSLPQVSQQLNLLKQNQTTIDYGNLLTLPVAGGLLYMEPIYIERADQESSFPQLAKVLVSFGGKIGYDARLDVALSQVFGPGAAAPVAVAGGSATKNAAPATPSLGTAGSDIEASLNKLRAAQKSGDFAAQGRALADLDKAAKRFQAESSDPPSGH